MEQVATTSGTTTTTAYIGSLEEVSVTGATTTTTAYYGGLALAVNGALRYTLSDGLGSVSESVNTSDGSVTATQLYAPYGGVRYQSGTLPTDHGFTGQVSDAATSGLDYYGARYYDPVAWQFTSADTTLAGGLNRYAYVGGNPETRTDPSGHMTHSPEFSKVWYNQQESGTSPKAYVNQWAAPGSVQGFVTYVSQAALGTDALRQSYYTLFLDRHASTGDKVKAAVVCGVTLVTDAVTFASLVTLQPEIAEGAREADAAVLAIDDANVLSHGGGDAAGVLTDAGATCGLSFAASTLVATPQGERAIATLRVGQQVSAYDPTTGKRTTQTIARVFLNHDSDRLDVTLALPVRNTVQPQTATQDATSARAQRAQARRQGRRGPPDASGGATTATMEVIHTTANHPWLTADRGWLLAGALRVGEPVRLLDGGTARVVALYTLPGVGPMWDLSLDSVHTFAVGDAQAVVHNCDGSTLTDGTRVNYSQDSDGFRHSVNNHAIPEWLGRSPKGTATLSQAEQDTWYNAIKTTADNSRQILRWSTGNRPTIGVLGRFEGRPFLVQFDGASGDLVTAFFPNREQMYAISRLLRG